MYNHCLSRDQRYFKDDDLSFKNIGKIVASIESANAIMSYIDKIRKQNQEGSTGEAKIQIFRELDVCFNCAKKHKNRECPAKNSICAACNKIGHKTRACTTTPFRHRRN